MSDFLGTQFHLHAPSGTQKNAHSKTKSRSNRDTAKTIAFCYLLPKQHLQLLLLICFNQKFLRWGFYSLNVALMSKIRYTSKNNFHNTNASIWKVFRRICWRHQILLKINAATEALIIICKKSSEQIFLVTALDTGHPGSDIPDPSKHFRLIFLQE